MFDLGSISGSRSVAATQPPFQPPTTPATTSPLRTSASPGLLGTGLFGLPAQTPTTPSVGPTREQKDDAQAALDAAQRRLDAATAAAQRAQAASDTPTSATKIDAPKAQEQAATLFRAEADEDLARKELALRTLQQQDLQKGLEQPSAATLEAQALYDAAAKVDQVVHAPQDGTPAPLVDARQSTTRAQNGAEDASQALAVVQQHGGDLAKPKAEEQQAIGTWIDAVEADLQLTALDAAAQGQDVEAALQARARAIADEAGADGVYDADAVYEMLTAPGEAQEGQRAPPSMVDAIAGQSPEQTRLQAMQHALDTQGAEKLEAAQRVVDESERAAADADAAAVPTAPSVVLLPQPSPATPQGPSITAAPWNGPVLPGLLQAPATATTPAQAQAEAAHARAEAAKLDLQALQLVYGDAAAGTPGTAQASLMADVAAEDEDTARHALLDATQQGVGESERRTLDIAWQQAADRLDLAKAWDDWARARLTQFDATRSGADEEALTTASERVDAANAAIQQIEADLSAPPGASATELVLQEDAARDEALAADQAVKDAEADLEAVRQLGGMYGVDPRDAELALGAALERQALARGHLEAVEAALALRDVQYTGERPKVMGIEARREELRTQIQAYQALLGTSASPAAEGELRSTLDQARTTLADLDKQLASHPGSPSSSPQGPSTVTPQQEADWLALAEQRQNLSHRIDAMDAQLRLLDTRRLEAAARHEYGQQRPDFSGVDLKTGEHSVEQDHALTFGITPNADGSVNLSGLPEQIRPEDVHVLQVDGRWVVRFDKDAGVHALRSAGRGGSYYADDSKPGDVAIDSGHDYELDADTARLWNAVVGQDDVAAARATYERSAPDLDGVDLYAKDHGTAQDHALTHGITPSDGGRVQIEGLPADIKPEDVHVSKEDGQWYVVFDRSTGARDGREGEEITIEEGYRYLLNPDAARLWDAATRQSGAGESSLLHAQDELARALNVVRQDRPNDASGVPLPAEAPQPLQGPDGRLITPIDLLADPKAAKLEADQQVQEAQRRVDTARYGLDHGYGDPAELDAQVQAAQSDLAVAQARQQALADVQALQQAQEDLLIRDTTRRLNGGEAGATLDDKVCIAMTPEALVADRRARAEASIAAYDAAVGDDAVLRANLRLDAAHRAHDAWLELHPYMADDAGQSATGREVQAAEEALASASGWQGLAATHSARMAERDLLASRLSQGMVGDPQSAYTLFMESPENARTLAQATMNEAYLRNGGQPIQAEGRTHLRNLVGAEMGIVPTVAVDPAHADEALKTQDLYAGLDAGQQAFLDNIVDQIVHVGGDHARVTIVPVMYALKQERDDGKIEQAGGLVRTAIFKVESDSEPGTSMFVDESGARYDDIDEYRGNNRLPVEGVNIVMPEDGNFSLDEHGNVRLFVGDARTETGWQEFRREWHVDSVVGGLAMVGGVLLIVGTAGTFTPVAGALMLGGASLYGIGTSAHSLSRRHDMGLSINPFTSAEARMDWMNIGVSMLALPGVGTASRTSLTLARIGAAERMLGNGVKSQAFRIAVAEGAERAAPGLLRQSVNTWTGRGAMVVGTGATADSGIYLANNWEHLSTAEKWEYGGMFTLDLGMTAAHPAIESFAQRTHGSSGATPGADPATAPLEPLVQGPSLPNEGLATPGREVPGGRLRDNVDSLLRDPGHDLHDLINPATGRSYTEADIVAMRNQAAADAVRDGPDSRYDFLLDADGHLRTDLDATEILRAEALYTADRAALAPGQTHHLSGVFGFEQGVASWLGNNASLKGHEFASYPLLVDDGHATSQHAGGVQRGLQSVAINRSDAVLEQQGFVARNELISIGGAPIEMRTALRLVDEGHLTMDAVARAPRVRTESLRDGHQMSLQFADLVSRPQIQDLLARSPTLKAAFDQAVADGVSFRLDSNGPSRTQLFADRRPVIDIDAAAASDPQAFVRALAHELTHTRRADDGAVRVLQHPGREHQRRPMDMPGTLAGEEARAMLTELQIRNEILATDGPDIFSRLPRDERVLHREANRRPTDEARLELYEAHLMRQIPYAASQPITAEGPYGLPVLGLNMPGPRKTVTLEDLPTTFAVRGESWPGLRKAIGKRHVLQDGQPLYAYLYEHPGAVDPTQPRSWNVRSDRDLKVVGYYEISSYGKVTWHGDPALKPADTTALGANQSWVVTVDHAPNRRGNPSTIPTDVPWVDESAFKHYRSARARLLALYAAGGGLTYGSIAATSSLAAPADISAAIASGYRLTGWAARQLQSKQVLSHTWGLGTVPFREGRAGILTPSSLARPETLTRLQTLLVDRGARYRLPESPATYRDAITTLRDLGDGKPSAERIAAYRSDPAAVDAISTLSAGLEDVRLTSIENALHEHGKAYGFSKAQIEDLQASIRTLRDDPTDKTAARAVDAAALRLSTQSREALATLLVEHGGRRGVWSADRDFYAEALKALENDPADLSAMLTLQGSSGNLWSSHSPLRRTDDLVTMGTIAISGTTVANWFATHGLHLNVDTAYYTTAGVSVTLVGLEASTRLLARRARTFDVEERGAARAVTWSQRLNAGAGATLLGINDVNGFLGEPTALGAAKIGTDLVIAGGATWGLGNESRRLWTGQLPRHPYWPIGLMIGGAGARLALQLLFEEDPDTGPPASNPTSPTTTSPTTTTPGPTTTPSTTTAPTTTTPTTTSPTTTVPPTTTTAPPTTAGPTTTPAEPDPGSGPGPGPTVQPDEPRTVAVAAGPVSVSTLWGISAANAESLLTPEERAAASARGGDDAVTLEALQELVGLNPEFGFDLALMDGRVTTARGDPDRVIPGWVLRIAPAPEPGPGGNGPP